MENKRTYVVIDLDRPRRIKYSFNAMADFEPLAGVPFTDVLSGDAKMGFNSIRAMLYCGLKWEDRTLTPEKVGKMIDAQLSQGVSLKDILAKVMDAIKNAELFKSSKAQDETEFLISEEEMEEEMGN